MRAAEPGSLGLGWRRSLNRDDLGERNYTIFTVPLSATFDHRDDSLNATSGYYAKVGLTPFFDISGTENGIVTTLDSVNKRHVGFYYIYVILNQANRFYLLG